MATPNTPSLSPGAMNPNDVDFHKLRLFIEEHFRALPDSMQLVTRHLEADSICPFYVKHRICPSLFTNYACQATYHPEFILRDGALHWMPRTWICRALQRHLANMNDAQCPINECPYSHAGNWAAAEQLAFRALALRTQEHNMGLLWYEQPEDSGCHPLYQISSPSALRVLQFQPFITIEQWSNHRYNKDIPSPPTYGPEQSEVRIITRTQTLRRSTTPRRHRSPTPVRREHHNRPQQLVPETNRDTTPPTRNTEQPSSSNRTHSATRNKIGHKAAPPPPPDHYIPRTESLTQRHFHGIDPFDEDSDGLEFPPANLTISRPIPRTQPPQTSDFQLLPQLRIYTCQQPKLPTSGHHRWWPKLLHRWDPHALYAPPIPNHTRGVISPQQSPHHLATPKWHPTSAQTCHHTTSNKQHTTFHDPMRSVHKDANAQSIRTLHTFRTSIDNPLCHTDIQPRAGHPTVASPPTHHPRSTISHVWLPCRTTTWPQRPASFLL